MAKIFVIDVARCSGCYNCQLACKDEHVDNDWAPYAKPQPKTGQFWMKVDENIGGTVPKVKIHYIPHLCNHCDKASCIEACPVPGAIYKREDGLVIIDPTKCDGCKKCLTACPYDAIYFNDALKLAQKCTGCAHLLDNGSAKPRCVDVCPTGALQFGEAEDLKELIVGATVMKPETGISPRVYYKNIPGRFIAGTVYDPAEQDVVEGAKCHLSAGPRVWDVITDDFGDFWLKDLPTGTFNLSITAEGYQPKYITGLSTDKDINLGDLPIDKK